MPFGRINPSGPVKNSACNPKREKQRDRKDRGKRGRRNYPWTDEIRTSKENLFADGIGPVECTGHVDRDGWSGVRKSDGDNDDGGNLGWAKDVFIWECLLNKVLFGTGLDRKSNQFSAPHHVCTGNFRLLR